MKRNVALVACVTLVLGLLTGCGNNDADTTKTADNANDSISIMDIDPTEYIDELGDYSNVAVEVPAKAVIDDAMVEACIANMLSQMPSTVKTDKQVVETGDIVNIDYEGKLDGVAFEGGTAQGYDLTIGSGMFIDGFEDGLIGKKVGETVVLPLTFPENYGNAELSGKETEFTVTINYIGEEKEPELNDETAAEAAAMMGLSDITDAAGLKNYVKKNLIMIADSNYEADLREAVLDEVIKVTKFTDKELPATMTDYYIGYCKQSDAQQAASYGTTLQEYVEAVYSMSYDEYETSMKQYAQDAVKRYIVCAQIAQLEGITMTEQDAVNLIKAANPAVTDEEIDSSVNKEDLVNYALSKAVVEKILQTATVKDVAKSEVKESVETEASTEE